MFLADLPGFKNTLFLNFKRSFFLAHPNVEENVKPCQKIKLSLEIANRIHERVVLNSKKIYHILEHT